MVQLNSIKPKIAKSQKKRIGRGGKRGTYSGGGIKGQKSRAGHKIRPALRDIIKKIPKKRGDRFKSLQKPMTVISLKTIEEKFKENEKVTPKALALKKLIQNVNVKTPQVKILDSKDFSKKVNFSGCAVSEKARIKIEKAGGKIIS